MKRKLLIGLIFTILSSIPIFAQQPLLGVRRGGVTHKFGLADIKNKAVAIDSAQGKTITVQKGGVKTYARIRQVGESLMTSSARLPLKVRIGTAVGTYTYAVLPYVCYKNTSSLQNVGSSLDTVFIDFAGGTILYSPYNSRQFWRASIGGGGVPLTSFDYPVLEIACDNSSYYAVSNSTLYISGKSSVYFSSMAPAWSCKTFFGKVYSFYNGVITRRTGSSLSSPALSGSNYTRWCVDDSENIFWNSSSTLIKGSFYNSNVASVRLPGSITGITCIRGRNESLVLVLVSTSPARCMLFDTNLNYLGDFRGGALPVQLTWLPFVSSNNNPGAYSENLYCYLEGGYVKQCNILE